MAHDTPAAQGTIPLFYRILFTWIDPLAALWTSWALLTDPDLITNTYIPRALSVRDPRHDFFPQQLGGAFFYIAASQAALLRYYPNDAGAWRLLNAGLLGFDAAVVYSLWCAMSAQGRLDPAGWRVEDYTTVVMTGIFAVSRAAIVAGVGLQQRAVGEVKRA